jgi:hypothetical protein
MSDVTPRRPARAAERNEIARGEAMPTETGPIIIPQPPAAPEAASVRALIVPDSVRQAAAESVAESVGPPVAAADDAWTALAEVQAAFARGFEEITVEMTGIARSGIAAAADAAMAMLGARTFAETVEINAGLARRGADAMIEGSARLSDIGVKAASEASRPILSRFGAHWSGAGLG